jgi:hypothetical protein
MCAFLANISKISKRLQQVLPVLARPGILPSYNNGLEIGTEQGLARFVPPDAFSNLCGTNQGYFP